MTKHLPRCSICHGLEAAHVQRWKSGPLYYCNVCAEDVRTGGNIPLLEPVDIEVDYVVVEENGSGLNQEEHALV